MQELFTKIKMQNGTQISTNRRRNRLYREHDKTDVGVKMLNQCTDFSSKSAKKAIKMRIKIKIWCKRFGKR